MGVGFCRLRTRGIGGQATKRSGQLGKMHYNLMVIDDWVTIGGSFDYAGPARKSSTTRMFSCRATFKEVTQASLKGQKDLAGYARTEIERIIEEFGEKII